MYQLLLHEGDFLGLFGFWIFEMIFQRRETVSSGVAMGFVGEEKLFL